MAISVAALGYGRWPRPQRPHRRVLWWRPCRQSGCLEFLSQRSLAAGCTLPVRAEGCHHEKLPKRPHARHCPGAPRAPLDSLRAVGAVQAGAAVGAEVVACLYVDHRVSAHGALLFLASSHPPCAGIRSILLMPAGTVPAAAVTLLVCVPAPELPHAGIASQMRPARSGPHRASRTWPRRVPEPNGPIPGPIWLHGSGRSPGASGIPAIDALSPQLALKAPLCLPVQPVCMVAVP